MTMTVTPQAQTQTTSAVSTATESKQADTTGSTPGAPVEATPPAPLDPLAPKFAALAKQQKALRAQQRDFEAQKQALEQSKQEIEQAKAWKQKLTQDPWTVMLEAGLSPEQATEIILNKPKPEDVKLSALQTEIQALRAAQTASELNVQKAQQQQYEQAKKQIRQDVTSMVEVDAAYEAIKAEGAQEAVVELIEQTFHEDGTLLSLEDAAKQVEDFLMEKALTLAKLQKIQARLAPPPATEPQKPTPHQKQPVQTLTNRAVQALSKPMSEKDRRERAIAAFRGQQTS